MVARFDKPSAVPIMSPTISPMAQPVRQCNVALTAMRLTLPMSWCPWSDSWWPWVASCADGMFMMVLRVEDDANVRSAASTHSRID